MIRYSEGSFVFFPIYQFRIISLTALKHPNVIAEKTDRKISWFILSNCISFLVQVAAHQSSMAPKKGGEKAKAEKTAKAVKANVSKKAPKKTTATKMVLKSIMNLRYRAVKLYAIMNSE